jgi:hypothetical protein
MEKVIVLNEEQLETLYWIVNKELEINENDEESKEWYGKVQTIKNKLDEQNLLLAETLDEGINKDTIVFDDDNFMTDNIYFRDYVDQKTGEKYSETYYRYSIEKFGEEE